MEVQSEALDCFTEITSAGLAQILKWIFMLEAD